MALEFKDKVPLSRQFDDLYFSRHGGWAEKDFVFVQGNNLPARFAAAIDFTIAELGFGTGLSFLAALAAWRQYAAPDAKLHFYSVEAYPLSRDDIQAALKAQDVPQDLMQMLLTSWPQNIPRQDVILEVGGVALHVLVGDVVEKLGALPASIGAWFLDGFSPAKNSIMWGDEVWRAMKEKSASGATAATYSCALVVREGLVSAGFDWHKVKGYRYKDGMIVGVRQN